MKKLIVLSAAAMLAIMPTAASAMPDPDPCAQVAEIDAQIAHLYAKIAGLDPSKPNYAAKVAEIMLQIAQLEIERALLPC